MLVCALFAAAVYVLFSMLDVDGSNTALWPVEDVTFGEALQAQAGRVFSQAHIVTLAPAHPTTPVPDVSLSVSRVAPAPAVRDVRRDRIHRPEPHLQRPDSSASSSLDPA